MNSIEMSHVTKDYQLGKTTVSALKGIELQIAPGEFTVIAGPSGSGKTTLLNLIGCMDTPTSGVVKVAGQETLKLKETELTNLRLHKIGFIFQSFNLISVLNVFDNVEFPLLLMKNLTSADFLLLEPIHLQSKRSIHSAAIMAYVYVCLSIARFR